MKEKLTMHIPEGIATALSRRHNGREDITKDEILEGIAKMNILLIRYKKLKEKLDYCEGEWWDKTEVEKHFQSSHWYYAHRKRKKLMSALKDTHRAMFSLMVYTDGNYEPFDSGSMYAEDIAEDFNSKYLKRLKDF